MKNLILFILFNLSLMGLRAGDDGEKDCFPIHPEYVIPHQSSTDGKNIAENAFDRNAKTMAMTEVEDRTWFLSEFLGTTKIKEVRVASSSLEDYYLFFSKAEFVSTDISELLQDPWVKYVHVEDDDEKGNNKEGTDIIPVDNYIANYVLLLPVKSVPIEISELYFCGTGPGDPEGPLPCEICPVHDLEPWFAEDCDNGIDDDGDGLVDCEDGSCGIGNVKTWVTDATCETCNDGKVCFRAANATHFSIDGGLTWKPVTGWFFFKKACFDNLLPGVYNVFFKNENSGCEGPPFSLVIDFPPPPPPPGDPCDETGFENGFTGWTPGNGLYLNVITNNNLDPNFQAIVPTAGFADVNAPGLTAPPAQAGANVARLGNTNAGGTAHTLTYCFDVDQDNFSINFLNAIVLHDPGHNGPSGFQYRVYDNGNPAQNLVGPVITNSTDPVLQPGVGTFMFLDWNCNSVNVTGQSGNTICIEFLTHGCSQSAHAGYAYIDVLCDDISVAPTVNNLATDEACDGHVTDIFGTGTFYHSYNWEIELFRNGSYSNTITTPVVRGLNPSVGDVFAIFMEEHGDILKCDDELSVTLTLYNDCASASENILIDFPCISWKATYPNIFAHNPANADDDEFTLYFNATDYSEGESYECAIMGNDITTITYYRLQVFDRWGNKVYDEETSSADANVLGSELVWDGDFNGTPVVSGVFSFLVYAVSCGAYLDCTNDCGSFQYCTDGDLEEVEDKSGNTIYAEVFADDVTVID